RLAGLTLVESILADGVTAGEAAAAARATAFALVVGTLALSFATRALVLRSAGKFSLGCRGGWEFQLICGQRRTLADVAAAFAGCRAVGGGTDAASTAIFALDLAA